MKGCNRTVQVTQWTNYRDWYATVDIHSYTSHFQFLQVMQLGWIIINTICCLCSFKISKSRKFNISQKYDMQLLGTCGMVLKLSLYSPWVAFKFFVFLYMNLHIFQSSWSSFFAEYHLSTLVSRKIFLSLQNRTNPVTTLETMVSFMLMITI